KPERVREDRGMVGPDVDVEPPPHLVPENIHQHVVFTVLRPAPPRRPSVPADDRGEHAPVLPQRHHRLRSRERSSEHSSNHRPITHEEPPPNIKERIPASPTRPATAQPARPTPRAPTTRRSSVPPAPDADRRSPEPPRSAPPPTP